LLQEEAGAFVAPIEFSSSPKKPIPLCEPNCNPIQPKHRGAQSANGGLPAQTPFRTGVQG